MKAISFLKVLPIIGLFSGTLLAQEFPKPEEKPDFQFISTDGLSELKGHTSRPIPNQYIVILNPTVAKTALQVYESQSFSTRDEQVKTGIEVERTAQNNILALAQKLGISQSSLLGIYSGVNVGFFATIPDDVAKRLIANIKQFPEVSSITQDQTVARAGELTKSKVPHLISMAQSVPWGVSFTGWTNMPNQIYWAWILDTGIDLQHQDLNVLGSAPFAKSFIAGQTVQDGHGHGTHVAGTVAAKNNTFGVVGVAAGARVVPVKVLSNSGSGSWGGVLAGVNHVATYGIPGDVVNMSLGGTGTYAALETAIATLAGSRKIFFSIAAGNSNLPATGFTPARTNGVNVYTISAMDNRCNIAGFSNYGNPPVDFAAPGVGILSTYKGNAYATMSGTSMAAPHVAGILLLNSGLVRNGGCCAGRLCTDKDAIKDLVAKR
ncbi:MAG: S8 family serine peptidase [Bacteroidota bacterium]